MSEVIRISVVVPAFNAAGTVVASVESCLNQTAFPYEVIVVDDGSSDGTADLLHLHFGNRINLIRLEKNLGPSAARNRGVEAASGSHIAFQDSDDFWHPNKLKCIQHTLQQRPEIKFLFHRFTLDAIGQNINLNAHAAQYPFWKMLLRNPVATPCAIIQREIIQPFNEEMKYMEDYELFLRLSYQHKLFLLDLPLTRLGRPVLSAGGQSEQKLKMRVGEWKAWAGLCRYYPRFYFVLPFLGVWSVAKHLGKMLNFRN